MTTDIPTGNSTGPSTDVLAGAGAPTALIAEDEPLLARALERALLAAWPELRIVARAGDGPAASAAALAERPQIMFLDIQMPGQTGLEVAAEVVDEWPDGPGDGPPPLLVFVTAYEQHAVAAFERAAVDYLLKPATPERLAETVVRLRERLAARAQARMQAGSAPGSDPSAGAALVQRLQALDVAREGGEAAEKIRVIRAGQGNRVRMISLAEVVCFEAADKYVNVVTESGGDALVRISLRELAARLDGSVEFLQVHRAVLVNAGRIAGAERDEAGHYWLSLRGLARPLKVSRAFSHLFRPM